jgi:hypothetical protein
MMSGNGCEEGLMSQCNFLFIDQTPDTIFASGL